MAIIALILYGLLALFLIAGVILGVIMAFTDFRSVPAKLATVPLAALAIVVIAAPFWMIPIRRLSAQEITCTVQDKYLKSFGKDSQRYMIECGEGEVLENSDSVAFWKFDSADVYAKIRVGQTYRFTVAGWRVPMLSWFRNVIAIRR